MAEIDVKWLASLSKIEFSDEEAERMKKDMTSITALMDSILDVKLSSVSFEDEPIGISDLREDKVMPSTPVDVLTAQCADTDGLSYIIPKIL